MLRLLKLPHVCFPNIIFRIIVGYFYVIAWMINIVLLIIGIKLVSYKTHGMKLEFHNIFPHMEKLFTICCVKFMT